MNVLIISTFDIFGGAGKAAYRLNDGLNSCGINSFMLVKEKRSPDRRVLTVKPLDDHNSLNHIRIFKKITKEYIGKIKTDSFSGRFSLGYPGFDLGPSEAVRKADIINLHWVDEFLSPESVYGLLKLGKPLIWTLHDHNPFTGGCHYTLGCELFKKDCKPCPQLDNDSFNIAYYNLKYKRELIDEKKITLVSPSKWLAGVVRQSSIFQTSNIKIIANSIDTDSYTPQDKKKAKREAGIDEKCITILTGVSSWNPRRKGFGELLTILKYLKGKWRFKNLIRKKKVLLLSMGNPGKELKDLKIPFRAFEYTDSEKELSNIYNRADLFLLPSTEDNLPNTMLEAMACATPVIAFQVGGMTDVIKDGKTGRLLPLKDTRKFAEAILDLIFHPNKRTYLGGQSRMLIEKEYKLVDQAKRYSELFYELLPEGYSQRQNVQNGESQDCPLDFSFNDNLLPLYREHINR
jgi:glycosyltransferase involved in cell wall biosynthesis